MAMRLMTVVLVVVMVMIVMVMIVIMAATAGVAVLMAVIVGMLVAMALAMHVQHVAFMGLMAVLVLMTVMIMMFVTVMVVVIVMIVAAAARLAVVMIVIVGMVVGMVMEVIMAMVVLVIMFRRRQSRVLAGAPDHPDRHRHDDHPRGELQIRLEGLRRDALPEIDATEGDRPYDQRVRDRGREAEQHGLPHGSPYGDDEGGHQRLGMARLQPVQRAEKDRAGNEKPAMGGALLEKLGKGGHGSLDLSGLAREIVGNAGRAFLRGGRRVSTQAGS